MPHRLRVLRPIVFPALFLFLVQCGSDRGPDVASLSAFTEAGVHVVVEIPAGTNLKVEYDREREVFAPDQVDGQDRVVSFLPYPANYGFIPSTLMDPAEGGDGDPVDVLLLCSSLATGSVVEARPIGALRLRDGGELDTKIVAVPLDPAYRTIEVNTFRDFMIGYDGARRILEEWFLNYKGLGETTLLGWENETFAQQEIQRWAVFE